MLIWADKESAYVHLVGAYGCGPFDGACYPVAMAIQKEVGGEVLMMVNLRDQAQHACVLADGLLWDAAGPMKSSDKIAQFNREENSPAANQWVVGLRSPRKGDLEESAGWAADPEGIEAIRSLFKSNLKARFQPNTEKLKESK